LTEFRDACRSSVSQLVVTVERAPPGLIRHRAALRVESTNGKQNRRQESVSSSADELSRCSRNKFLDGHQQRVRIAGPESMISIRIFD